MERGAYFDRDYAAVVQELYTRGLNDRNPRVVERLVAPGLVVHHLDTGEETRGRRAFVKGQSNWLEAVPDYYVSVEDVVTDADRAVARLTCYGTPVKPHEAAQPTGRSFAVSALHEFRFEDGKIAEAWLLDDRMAMVRQLGLLPDSLGDLFRVVGHRLRWLLFDRPRTARGKPIDPEQDLDVTGTEPETRTDDVDPAPTGASTRSVAGEPVGDDPAPDSTETATAPSADPVSPATWRAADRLGRAMTTVNKDCAVDGAGDAPPEQAAGDGVTEPERIDPDRTDENLTEDEQFDDDLTDDGSTDDDLTDAESPPSARV